LVTTSLRQATSKTLMGTFKIFAIYVARHHLFGGLIFAGIRMMSGRFQFAVGKPYLEHVWAREFFYPYIVLYKTRSLLLHSSNISETHWFSRNLLKK
jgi:hypothetical protein